MVHLPYKTVTNLLCWEFNHRVSSGKSNHLPHLKLDDLSYAVHPCELRRTQLRITYHAIWKANQDWLPRCWTCQFWCFQKWSRKETMESLQATSANRWWLLTYNLIAPSLVSTISPMDGRLSFVTYSLLWKESLQCKLMVIKQHWPVWPNVEDPETYALLLTGVYSYTCKSWMEATNSMGCMSMALICRRNFHSCRGHWCGFGLEQNSRHEKWCIWGKMGDYHCFQDMRRDASKFCKVPLTPGINLHNIHFILKGAPFGSMKSSDDMLLNACCLLSLDILTKLDAPKALIYIALYLNILWSSPEFWCTSPANLFYVQAKPDAVYIGVPPTCHGGIDNPAHSLELQLAKVDAKFQRHASELFLKLIHANFCQ